MNAKDPDLDTCPLCLERGVLQGSHIVSEFLWERMYDEKHRYVRVRRDDGTFTLQQKGAREKLLCTACEQLLNEQYEKPFRRIWTERLLTATTVAPRFLVTGVDYAQVRLFVLSVLWRAHVAREPMWASVKLGSSHAERLRRMVLAGDPGEAWRYPIAAGVTVLDGKPLQMVNEPSTARVHGGRLYVLYFGGFFWAVGVANHRFPAGWMSNALRPDGSLPVYVEAAEDSKLVIETVKASRRLADRFGPPFGLREIA